MLMEKLILMMVVACHFSSATEPKKAVRFHCIEVPIERCECECRLLQTFRVVGGVQALPHEFPWMVAILSTTKNFLGGGTLITSKHVLTAAHLIKKQKKGLIVILGSHNIHDSEDGLQIHVQAIKITRPFKSGEDIAILVLNSSVPFGPHIQPACLPPEGPSTYVGMKGIVAGWGVLHEKYHVPAESLQKTVVPIISISTCNSSYDVIRNDMICAGYPDGDKDACKGDSGGPLHIIRKSYLEVVGIVSFGKGCGRPNTPGVYTRISSFIPWIQKSVGQECLCQIPHYK